MRNINLSSGVTMDFVQVLKEIQKYFSSQHSDVALEDKFQVKRFVKKKLEDEQYTVEGMSLDELTYRLCQEMSEYSFLTPYLNFTIKDVEGIEIDSWDSVKVKYAGGRYEFLDEHFFSPEHAETIMKRILHQTKIEYDEAKPLARGHLENNTRITITGAAVLDNNVGIASSIRFVNPSNLKKQDLIRFGSATEEMLDFLSLSYRYGASMLLAGETDAGKTTLMSIIMDIVPNNKKLITIENTTREFNKVKRDKNHKVINSVIHLVTRESEDPAKAVTQQMEVEHSMTMNPDYLCMAEIKGSEASEAIEASLTGHPVIGTTHTDECRTIPDRLVQLASYHKSSNLSDTMLMRLATKAFPILFYARKCEDDVRRITEICECWMENGIPVFQTLWEFVTVENKIEEGKTIIDGYFKKTGTISNELQNRLRRKGMPEKILQQFLKKEGVSTNDAD